MLSFNNQNNSYLQSIREFLSDDIRENNNYDKTLADAKQFFKVFGQC